VRAGHLLRDRPVVFSDPYALALTSSSWRVILGNRLLNWLVTEKLLGVLRPVHGQILARARYAEECLAEAVASGVRQYVIIGAGLDSFALRHEGGNSSLSIYELDHPATQAIKRTRLARFGAARAPALVMVPVDFERATVAEALRGTTFDPGQPAFFSWLGTTHYLTEGAIFGTLRSVAGLAAKGSEIVLDFSVPQALVAPADLPAVVALRRFVERRGEPFVSQFEPGRLEEQVISLGFSHIESLSPAEQDRRYFSGRTDGLRASGFGWLTRFRVS
jgi:methyltransferase (TIGR00027 family)